MTYMQDGDSTMDIMNSACNSACKTKAVALVIRLQYFNVITLLHLLLPQ